MSVHHRRCQQNKARESRRQSETLHVPLPLHDKDVAPKDMEACSDNLSDHRNPSTLHTIQEALRHIIHAKHVYTEQVVHDVSVRMLNNGFFLPEQRQNLPREEQDRGERDEEDGVDDTGSVKVFAAKDKLICTVSMGHECFQSTVHAHYNIEREAL